MGGRGIGIRYEEGPLLLWMKRSVFPSCIHQVQPLESIRIPSIALPSRAESRIICAVGLFISYKKASVLGCLFLSTILGD